MAKKSVANSSAKSVGGTMVLRKWSSGGTFGIWADKETGYAGSYIPIERTASMVGKSVDELTDDDLGFEYQYVRSS